MGAYVEYVHQALMESPPPHANLTNPQYTHAGFGVARAAHGTFVAQVFMTLAPPSAPAPAPVAPAPPPVAQPEPAAISTPAVPSPAPAPTAPRPPPPATSVPPAAPAAAAPVFTTSAESLAALPASIPPAPAAAPTAEPAAGPSAADVGVLGAPATRLASSSGDGGPGPANLPAGLAGMAVGLASAGQLAAARRRFVRTTTRRHSAMAA